MTKPTYEELERENARLHDRLNTVISDREHFVRLMNEARYWAIYWKRKYLWILSD